MIVKASTLAAGALLAVSQRISIRFSSARSPPDFRDDSGATVRSSSTSARLPPGPERLGLDSDAAPLADALLRICRGGFASAAAASSAAAAAAWSSSDS